jgi:protein SCO1/2
VSCSSGTGGAAHTGDREGHEAHAAQDGHEVPAAPATHDLAADHSAHDLAADHSAHDLAADHSAQGGGGDPADAAHADHAAMNHQVLPAGEAVTGSSLYQLDVSLTGQDGKERTWDDLRGGPVLTSMVYASCTTACPLIVSEIQTILAAAAPPDVKILLVSMDPERDDPAALRAMAERHGLDERWILAASDDEGVRQWSAALGVRYRKLPSGDFNHSQVIALLDGSGSLVARAEGLGAQRDAVIQALRPR